MLVWDLTLARRRAGLAGKKLTAEELAALWKDLAGSDTARASRALWQMADAPDASLPFLGQHLKPTSAGDTARLQQLITDLDNDQFAVREAAYKELEKRGSVVEPALREALNRNPTPEARRRIEGLLANIGVRAPSAEVLRRLRAIQVLEQIGSTEARRLLTELARGVAHARETQEAKAALERLGKRAGVNP